MTTAGPIKNIFILPGITGPTGLFEIVNILATGPTNGTGATGDLPHRLKTYSQITGPTGAGGPTGTFKTVCYAGATGLVGKRTIIVPGYAGGGGGGAGTVWSATDNTDAAGNGLTLTNVNLTATRSSGGGTAGIRGTIFRSAGKLYLELTTTVAGGRRGAGLSNPAGVLDSIRFNQVGQFFLNNDGNTMLNGGVAVGGNTGIGDGTTVCLAVDFTAKLGWLRNLSDVNWNVSGTANPATGVGGFDLTGILTGGLAPFFGTENYDACTLHASAFSGAVPAGFSPWG